MSFEFRDAVRKNIGLLILLAGGTGSGKTESAMRLATGLSSGKPFGVIDTENGRALHKADDYTFQHTDLTEPFSPERYSEAVKDADEAGYPVIVIDSGSHEYEGIGGVLEIQAEEFERLGNRESARMSSWIVPKKRHKRFVRQLLISRPHVILCLRAEDKIEIVKRDGRTIVQPKESLIGADGWIPICEKRLPFEATISLLLTADAPGVPKPIKLERRHKHLVPLDQPLSEETGRLLGEWAAGAKTGPAEAARPADTTVAQGDRGLAPEREAEGVGGASDTEPNANGTPDLITEAQRRRLFAIAKDAGTNQDAIKQALLEVTGQDSTKAIPKELYDAVVAAVQGAGPAA